MSQHVGNDSINPAAKGARKPYAASNELTGIHEGAVADSMFELPPGYANLPDKYNPTR
jgi:hypothetical protein